MTAVLAVGAWQFAPLLALLVPAVAPGLLCPLLWDLGGLHRCWRCWCPLWLWDLGLLAPPVALGPCQFAPLLVVVPAVALGPYLFAPLLVLVPPVALGPWPFATLLVVVSPVVLGPWPFAPLLLVVPPVALGPPQLLLVPPAALGSGPPPVVLGPGPFAHLLAQAVGAWRFAPLVLVPPVVLGHWIAAPAMWQVGSPPLPKSKPKTWQYVRTTSDAESFIFSHSFHNPTSSLMLLGFICNKAYSLYL